MAYIIGSHDVPTRRRTGRLYCTFVSILGSRVVFQGVRIERGKEALRGGTSAKFSLGLD